MFSLYGIVFFFFNDTATTEIYTLSLHDALPICAALRTKPGIPAPGIWKARTSSDRKSTRLNSSHSQISYAVFCLKKKMTQHGGMPFTFTLLKGRTNYVCLAKL